MFKNNKINKILLIIPPANIFDGNLDINPIPPIGLGYLAASLKDLNKEIKIIDSLAEGWNNRVQIDNNIEHIGLSFEDIGKMIFDFKPDLVGVSNHFTRQRKNAHKIYSIVKKIKSDIITVAGGAHPTADPEEEIKNEFLDYIVLGEADHSFRDLILFLEDKITIYKLNGIVYKKNEIVKTIQKTKFI